MIGFGAGSVADIAARVVGARMSQTLGQQIVVENRTGAGSNLGAEYVTRAPKDGYTLLMATIAKPSTRRWGRCRSISPRTSRR